MIDYICNSAATQLLLLSECSVGDNIIAEHPQKDMVKFCSIRRPYMNDIAPARYTQGVSDPIGHASTASGNYSEPGGDIRNNRNQRR